MKISKTVLAVSAALLLTISTALLMTRFKRDRATPPVGQPASELRAVELPISYSAVTHLARTMGFVIREGLQYRVHSVPAGPDLINALRVTGSASVDLGSIATTPVAVMIGAGDRPVVLATLIASPAQVRLVALGTSGISADPTSLRGKRVGFVGSTVGEIYLSRLLAKVGMTESDIKGVNARPADLKALLLRGDLDAAVLWDPFIAQVARAAATANRGLPPRVFVETGLYKLTFFLVSMRPTVTARRADLVRFLSACVKAGDAIESNRAQAQRELEVWLGLESGDLKYFVDTTSFRVHLDSKQVIADLRGELEWLRSRQPSTQVPDDLSSYVDQSVLASVDPSRVVFDQ